MAFWTAARELLLARRAAAARAAVTREAKALTSFGRSDLVQFLPTIPTNDELKTMIKEDPQEFRRIVGTKSDKRTSVLTRILKRNNPDALTLGNHVDATGKPITDWEYREIKNARAAERRRSPEKKRERARWDMTHNITPGDKAVDFDSMSAPEYRTAMDGTDLTLPSEGERDDSVLDVPPELADQWEEEDMEVARATVQGYYETYLAQWEDPMNDHQMLDGYDEAREALIWLYENRPDVLLKMFNSGHDEMEIYYVIDSGQDYNPYINIPMQTRHYRAADYITSQAAAAGWSYGGV